MPEKGAHPDLENGDARKEEEQSSDPEQGSDPEQLEKLEEYAALVKYISTYREGRRKSIASAPEDEDSEKKSKWWKPWTWFTKKQADEAFVVPDDWIETDIKKGLSSGDIEPRRRKAGWNELTTEKENMFIKFLMYFTGPILYGECLVKWCDSSFFFDISSHGTCCPPGCWSTRLDRFRCHYWNFDAQCNCRLVPGETSCRCCRQSQR